MPATPDNRSLARATVLVTEDAPSYGVLAGVRALHAAGHRVWLAYTARGAYGRHSRVPAGRGLVPDPAADPAAYVQALVALAERAGAAAVLPGTDVGLSALAAARHAFGPGIALGVPDAAVVRRAGDKSQLAEVAADAGLRTPPTWVLSADDATASQEVILPAIVKVPEAGRAGAGQAREPVRRVATREALSDALAQAPGRRVIVQPFLEGRLIAVSGVAWEGAVVRAVHQAAERIYPAACGISAYARTVPAQDTLEQGVRALVKRLEWSGIFQAQFLQVDGVPLLIDFNPRMYGSLALAVAAGANLPALWADLLLGRDPEPGGYRVGVRFRSEERDAGALASALSGGDLRTFARGVLPHSQTAHAVFALRDPWPLARTLGRLARAPALLRRRRA